MTHLGHKVLTDPITLGLRV